jgi:PHD/YefM family antitoxin component YafN of YafNO toxin-antitoxin module
MVSTRNTQSLTDFRQNATETLDRLNKTGEAEILTVNGQARAVLLSPAAYDQMEYKLQLAKDVEVMRKSMKEMDEGKGIELHEAFDQTRAKLLAVKAAKERNS